MVVSARAYVRVSTEEQAQEGFSIPAQRARIADFCRSQGWEVAAWYIEEGASAKDLDRPELSRLRADLRPGEIVVVFRLDRLTRSVIDLYTLLAEWDRTNVRFRSVTEIYDTTTAMGRLFLTLVAALAQWERENLGERVKVGMTQMVRQGKWYGGPLPYGYDYDAAVGRLVVNREQALIVREIYRSYVKGKGTRAIAIELNQQGLRTKQGAEWSPFTVYWILRSPVYLGHTLWNKRGKGEAILVENTHDPILTPDLAEAVLGVLARHEGKHSREIASPYPMTGITRCGMCGARVNGRTQPQYDRNKVRRWESRDYWCQARKVRKACTLPSMGAERLETALLDRIQQLADPAVLRELAAVPTELPEESATEKATLEGELRAILRKKKRWYDAYESESITAADLRDRTGTLSAREAKIRQRLEQLMLQTPRLDAETVALQLQDFAWHWQHATVEEKRTLLAEFFEEVTVYPGYRVEVRPKPLRA